MVVSCANRSITCQSRAGTRSLHRTRSHWAHPPWNRVSQSHFRRLHWWGPPLHQTTDHLPESRTQTARLSTQEYPSCCSLYCWIESCQSKRIHPVQITSIPISGCYPIPDSTLASKGTGQVAVIMEDCCHKSVSFRSCVLSNLVGTSQLTTEPYQQKYLRLPSVILRTKSIILYDKRGWKGRRIAIRPWWCVGQILSWL